jgi:hypothetical protein
MLKKHISFRNFIPLIILIFPLIAFAGAGSYMGADPNDFARSGLGSGGNFVFGLIILLAMIFACIMFSVVRMIVYIFAILMTLAGITGSDLLVVGLVLLFACVAGTLWDPEEGVFSNRGVGQVKNDTPNQTGGGQFRSDEVGPNTKSFEEKSVTQNAKKHEDAILKHPSRKIVEKSDRAIHGRADSYDENNLISDQSLFSTPIEKNAKPHCAIHTEPFDLFRSDGGLAADVGMRLVDGFATFFREGEKPLMSTLKTFSTADDHQTQIKVVLAVRFKPENILDIGTYEISGISKNLRGIPQIRIEIAITQSALEICATESATKSNLEISKYK